jgi:ribonuclease HI
MKAMKGQVVANFIVDHNVNMEVDDECLVAVGAWKLHFDGSVCARGCGIGCVVKAPSGIVYEVSVRLEFSCTNNQVEYEALLAGLEWLANLGVKHVEASGDSKLVVQQMKWENQCLDSTLNQYHDRCMQVIKEFDTFYIEHVHRSKNEQANSLARQASEYEVKRGKFYVKDMAIVQEVSEVLTRGDEVSRDGVPGEKTVEDWRYVIKECIQDPTKVRDKMVRHQALRYTLLDGELYRRMVDGMLLGCLGEE